LTKLRRTVVVGEVVGKSQVGKARRTATAPKTEPRRAAEPRDQLYVVLEADRVLAGSARHSLHDLDEVTIGRGDGRRALRSPGNLAMKLPGAFLSTKHARLQRRDAVWAIEDLGSKNGTRLNGKPLTQRRDLRDGDLIEVGDAFLLFRSGVPHVRGDRDDLTTDEIRPPAEGLATIIPALAETFRGLARAARKGFDSVLVQGETGTGKELAARAVHTLSGRTGSFIAVNCGAIPDALIESELFGHKKGAFSGAVTDRKGLFELAHGGTLLLDEIGEMKPQLQVSLLRVLQDREVRPIGGSKPVTVDVQVVAATHRDLENEGRFRADLLARLTAYRVVLPPLRERREDLGILIGALVRKAGAEQEPPAFSYEVVRRVLEESWPMNIRQLEHVVVRAVKLAEGGKVRPDDVPELMDKVAVGKPVKASPVSWLQRQTGAAPSASIKREELVQLLREHGQVRTVAALLGKDPKQIRRWIKRYGIGPEDVRPSA
jgi:DNA-binding NtrC family response regulator